MKLWSLGLAVLLSGSMLLNTFPQGNVSAYGVIASSEKDFIENGDESIWKYKIVNSAEGISDTPFAELTGYSGDLTEVHIPKNIGGYPVKRIGGFSFVKSYYEASVNIYVPDSVKSISQSCISNIFDLTFYTEDGLAYICNEGNLELFFIPYDKKEVYVPDDVAGLPVTEMKWGLFDDGIVEKLRLSDNLPYIKVKSATLKSLNIPKSMHVIPSQLLTGEKCPALEDVQFHDEINLIAIDAFTDTKVVPPADKVVNNIDEIYFFGEHYTEADLKTGWCYQINIDEEGRPINALITYAPDLQGAAPTEYRGIPIIDMHLTDSFPSNMPYMVIRDGVKDTSKFSVNTPNKLVRVDIRSTDINIMNSMFMRAAIESLEFPGSAVIENNAAQECLKLKKLIFSGKEPTIKIGGEAFAKDKSLSDIVLPDVCKELEIGKYAFQYSAIEKLTLPKGTTTVDIGAFSNSESLKNVTVNDGKTICSAAFKGCSSLENVVFNACPELEAGAFEACTSLKNIDVDISKPINGRAFLNCPSLTQINGEEVFNNDGSPVEKYTDFIKKNFYDAENCGIIDNYTMYCVRKNVKEAVTDDMNDMQKVKALHDKLCSLTEYDKEDISANKNHTDVSVFINDETVCEGYARAMNLLLHEAGIESCYVYTPDHAWVIAKIGGHYFHVDPTWDDGNTVNYDWFMLSDSQICRDDSHKDFKITEPSDLHSFQWKTAPACNETMGDVNADGIVDGKDATAILSAYAKASAGDEMTVDTVLADVNFNGRVDAADASAVITKYAAESVK